MGRQQKKFQIRNEIIQTQSLQKGRALVKKPWRLCLLLLLFSPLPINPLNPQPTSTESYLHHLAHALIFSKLQPHAKTTKKPLPPAETTVQIPTSQRTYSSSPQSSPTSSRSSGANILQCTSTIISPPTLLCRAKFPSPTRSLRTA